MFDFQNMIINYIILYYSFNLIFLLLILSIFVNFYLVLLREICKLSHYNNQKILGIKLVIQITGK
jgi:hypothetical protein